MRFTFFLVLLLGCSNVGAANGWPITDLDREFFRDLRAAVIRHDAAHVASLVVYPIAVVIDGQRVEIVSPKGFIRNYRKIITPAIERVISEFTEDQLWKNSDGTMIGGGEVWFFTTSFDQGKHYVNRVYAISPSR